MAEDPIYPDLEYNYEKIIPWNGAQDTGRDARLKLDRNFAQVLRNLEKLIEYVNASVDALHDVYLHKDRPDRTAFLQSFLGGAVFGKDGFASGLTGFGAKIGEDGNGEMRGLRLWEWLEVPELRYNRVEAVAGIKWRSPGMGIIESCQPDRSPEGEQLGTGTVRLKLEDGELGMVVLDDIALGIYHFGNERDAVSDKDDSKGNFAVKGFATTYFRITGVSGKDNNTFTYSLRPGYAVHPQPQMHFVCYGNFTDESRQSSVYETRTYTRMLWKQNTWEIGKKNIALQQGDLTNLNIHGMNMQGYSMYINSVYFTGTVTQVKPDGTPVRVANDRGAWQAGKYDYYDRVSHNGCLWLCVNEKGTDSEPAEGNADWLKQVDKGAGMNPLGEWHDGLHVPRLGVVTMDGKAFTAHRATSNPPMWTVTDHDGRHILTKQGYILTGEMNTDDYYLIVEKGEQGNDGCVIRDSEWAPGVEYRNDSNINAPVRYIDVVLVRNDSTSSGYDAYRCLRTHVSSPSLDYTFTDFWEKFGSNVSAIFTSLIIAKNAKIRFFQGNELRIEKPDGTVTAGIRGGSGNGDKVRIWAGSADPNKAPFRVDEDGCLYAEKGTFKGNISIASRKILLNEDGSGQLAGGNISWNTSGDVRLSGEFSISKNGFTLKLDPNFSEYRIYDSSNRPVVSLQPFMDQPGSSPTLRLYHPSSGFDATLTVSGLSLGNPAGSYAAFSVNGLEFREGGSVFKGFTGQARINTYDNINYPTYKMLKIKNGIIYSLS